MRRRSYCLFLYFGQSLFVITHRLYFFNGGGNIHTLINMKNNIHKKETPYESIVATIEKKNEFEVAKGQTLETFCGYSLQERRVQLRWFVSKLLSLCDNPVNPNRVSVMSCQYGEVLRFSFDYVEESGLFPFGLRLDGKLHKVEKRDYIFYCEIMFSEIKRNIFKLNDMGFRFNEEEFTWFNEVGYPNEKNNIGSRNEFYIDTYFRPLFEAYLIFMDSNEKGSNNIERSAIEKIEIVEDKKEQGRINVFINGDYNNPRSFSRKKRWGKLYELASGKDIVFDKEVLDYFNYHPSNPLYTENGGFKVTTVLRKEDGYLVPNIKIILTTQNKITRQLKTLKKI